VQVDGFAASRESRDKLTAPPDRREIMPPGIEARAKLSVEHHHGEVASHETGEYGTPRFVALAADEMRIHLRLPFGSG
jgi:hypothetical protein